MSAAQDGPAALGSRGEDHSGKKCPPDSPGTAQSKKKAKNTSVGFTTSCCNGTAHTDGGGSTDLAMEPSPEAAPSPPPVADPPGSPRRIKSENNSDSTTAASLGSALDDLLCVTEENALEDELKALPNCEFGGRELLLLFNSLRRGHVNSYKTGLAQCLSSLQALKRAMADGEAADPMEAMNADAATDHAKSLEKDEGLAAAAMAVQARKSPRPCPKTKGPSAAPATPKTASPKLAASPAGTGADASAGASAGAAARPASTGAAAATSASARKSARADARASAGAHASLGTSSAAGFRAYEGAGAGAATAAAADAGAGKGAGAALSDFTTVKPRSRQSRANGPPPTSFRIIDNPAYSGPGCGVPEKLMQWITPQGHPISLLRSYRQAPPPEGWFLWRARGGAKMAHAAGFHLRGSQPPRNSGRGYPITRGGAQTAATPTTYASITRSSAANFTPARHPTGPPPAAPSSSSNTATSFDPLAAILDALHALGDRLSALETRSKLGPPHAGSPEP